MSTMPTIQSVLPVQGLAVKGKTWLIYPHYSHFEAISKWNKYVTVWMDVHYMGFAYMLNKDYLV